MKKNLICLILLVIFKSGCYAQETGNYINQVNNYNTLSNGVGQFDYVYKKVPEASPVAGNRYLFEQDNQALIYIKDQAKAYKVSALNYDVYRDLLEMNFNGEIKILSGARVDELCVFDAKSNQKDSLIRCHKLMPDQKLLGFCEVLNEGEIKLVKHPKATFTQPSYNTALMVGDKQKKITVSNEYYVGAGDGFFLIRTKSDIKTYLKKQNKDLSAYKHKVNVKDEHSLLGLVNFINTGTVLPD